MGKASVFSIFILSVIVSLVPNTIGQQGGTIGLKVRLVNGTLATGQPAVLRCFFTSSILFSDNNKPVFRWYFNDRLIPNSMLSSDNFILTSDGTADDVTLSIGTLIINSVSANTSGIYKCAVDFRSGRNSFNIVSKDFCLKALTRPTISISPLSLDVFEWTNFFLKCQMINMIETKNIVWSFRWSANNELITPFRCNNETDYQNNAYCVKSTSSDSILHVNLRLVLGSTRVKRPGTRSMFSCDAVSSNGPHISVFPRTNATVSFIASSDLFCNNNIEIETGMAWPVTKVNNTNYYQCPGNTTGRISRTCVLAPGKTAWLEPDYSECMACCQNDIRVKELENMLNAIESLKNGNGAASERDNKILKIAISVAGLTNSTSGLTSRVLNGSISVISGLAGLRKDPSRPPGDDEIQRIVQSISNLLQPTNNDSWMELLERDDAAAASLLSSAEVYGRGLSSLITDDSRLVKKAAKNMVLAARSFNKDNLPSNITFPDKDGRDPAQHRSDEISISTNAFDDDFWKGSGSLRVWSSYYHYIENYLPTSNHRQQQFVNSRILSLAINSPTAGKNLKQPVYITLQHSSQINERNGRAQCVFWDFDGPGSGRWSSVGCEVISSDANRTVCRCTHLTNFAVLVARDSSDDLALSIISKICCSISITALILTIIVYAITWKDAKSHQAVVLLNLCVALVVAYVIFLAGADKVESKDGCKAVAVLLHYFYLAAFFLMLAEGVQLLIYVVFVFHAKRKFETTLLLVSAWVLPLIIVAISLGVTLTHGYGHEKACWLSNQNYLIFAFIGPAFFIIAVNIVIVVIVLRHLSATRFPSSNNENQTKSNIKGMLWRVAVISSVFGLTWVLGVFTVIWSYVAFQYLFAIVNSLQGLFIFIFHALFHNKKINERLRTALGRYSTRIRKRKTETADGKRSKQKRSTAKHHNRGHVEELVEYYDQLGGDTSSGDTLGKDSSNTACTMLSVSSDRSQPESGVTSISRSTSAETHSVKSPRTSAND